MARNRPALRVVRGGAAAASGAGGQRGGGDAASTATQRIVESITAPSSSAG